MTKRVLWSAVLVALVFMTTVAGANTLAPGGLGAPDSLTVSGTVIADTGVLSWTSGINTGLARTEVYRDPTNTFCAGCLDFIFAVSLTTGDDIGRVTDTSFAGYLTDVGIATNLVGCSSATDVAPSSVNRNSVGDTVGFNFLAPNILAGGCSEVMVIETNATTYGSGTLNVIDGYVATIASFAVPEPASLAVLSGALLGLAGFVRRRFVK